MCQAEYLRKAELCLFAASHAQNRAIEVIWLHHYWNLKTKALRLERGWK
jgi:hypothetical protein